LRLWAALWRQWKTRRRCREALIALGVKAKLAGNTAASGLGPWHLARSGALSVGPSNKYFSSLGHPSLFGTCSRNLSNRSVAGCRNCPHTQIAYNSCLIGKLGNRESTGPLPPSQLAFHVFHCGYAYVLLPITHMLTGRLPATRTQPQS
jgi:hypothetical protein